MDHRIILRVNDLTTEFRNEERTSIAVNRISFSLREGEILGIVGESGSGKSVTALSVMGLIPFPDGRITGGEIIYTTRSGQQINLLSLPDSRMKSIRGKEISMIFQEPMTSLNPVQTCGNQVAEILRIHTKAGKRSAKQRTLELLSEVKLPKPEEIYRSYPHQLSGGQKQRVMIAMAMACTPSILIADEPTTALDVTVQKTILDLMHELQTRHRMSILFITHDLSLVSGFADRVLVMYRGEIVEEGETRMLFSAPRHTYTQGLLGSRPPKNVRFKRLPTIGDYQDKEKHRGLFSAENLLTKEERDIRLAEIYTRTPILEVRDLETQFISKFSLFGRKKRIVTAVDHVSFSVWPGETLGIVGESGSGKTTLGRSILRLVDISSGQVLFDGKELPAMEEEEFRKLRKDMQIIFQDPYSSLNPRITAGAAIMEPMKVHFLNGNDRKRKKMTMELLQKVGLEEGHFYRYPHEFSGGQRQRICIARALALNPRLIICDESVSALDVSVQAQVLNLLNDLKREFGFTYLFISHDLSVVRFMSDRIIVMKNGRIEETGDADEIYANPKSEYTRTLLEAVPGSQPPT